MLSENVTEFDIIVADAFEEGIVQPFEQTGLDRLFDSFGCSIAPLEVRESDSLEIAQASFVLSAPVF